MAVNEMDQTKAEVFSERMIGILNSGALALMSSIGHRTRLLDVMRDLPPSTSAQEAIATGRAAAEQQGRTNVPFEVKDVTALDASEQYKSITLLERCFTPCPVCIV